MKKTINRNYFIITYSIVLTAVLVFMLVFTNSAVGATQTNQSLSAESLTEQFGETLEVTVNAYGTNTQKCFSLIFDGKNAGLSEEYSFNNDEQTEITDNNGKKLLLNREIGGDGAVNYWFELAEGETTNFTLDCTSGVYVATVHDIEDFKSMMPQDETDEQGKLSDKEIIELIKSQKASENQDADTATLRISIGGGADLNNAKAETVKNDVLELNWNKEEQSAISLFSISNKEEYIDGGEIEGTSLTWAYTKKRTATKGTLTISGTGAMPDYTYINSTSTSTAPWGAKYRGKVNKIVIEDGVTRLGQNSFRNMGANELSLGKDITDISAQHIFNANNFKILKIPGTVKSVTGFGAFWACQTETIIFEEGVETVNAGAFWSNTINEVYIPKTVTSFTTSNYNIQNKKYIVDENNKWYYTIDDVLYKHNTNGTTSTLVSYPERKANIEYTVPDFVSSIGNYAIYQVSALNKLTIPDNVSLGTRCINGCTNLREITFGENNRLESFGLLSECSSLRSVHFPDNIFSTLSISWAYLVSNLTSLEEFNYPKGTKGIFHDSECVIKKSVTPKLKKLYYDIEDCTGFTSIAVSPDYELIIQENVNRLRKGFQNILNRSDKVKFIGNNQITIDEGAFTNKSEPLNALVGTVYVDEQGIVYKYDKSTSTASVAYVPYGLETAIIPETITPKTDVTCTITAVDTYSCKLAENLKSITFAKPENITSIGAYGFAYCTKLASINGKTTEEEVSLSFTGASAKIGYRAFVNTALEGASGGGSFSENMNGQKSLEVTKENMDSMYINLANTGDTLTFKNGGYRTLTGNTVSVNISAGNSTQAVDTVYRVYFEKSESDCSMSISPGNTIVINGTTVTCYATEAPNIMYIDFTPQIGNTATISIDAVYPSPSSKGGGLKVWGKILTAKEAETHRNDILEYTEITNSETGETSSDSIQVYWTTQPDYFTLTKTNNLKSEIRLIGDGNGKILPENDLSYSIILARTSDETSEYGKDYVRSVDFYDCVTLPEQVRWKDEVIQAIKNDDTHIIGSWLYAGDIKLMSASSAYGLSVELNEDESNIIFHWKIYNSSTTAEIGKNNTTFTISKDAVSVNSSVLEDVAKTKYNINNEVSANIHYTYSSDQSKEASVEKKFSLSDAEPKLSKTQSKNTYYFGEDVTYTLNFYNNGAIKYQSDDGNYTLTDTLPTVSYITPQNMDKMFNDTYGKHLTLKITNAKLCTETSRVTAEDNGMAYTNYANSNISSDKVVTDTLTIAWNGDKLNITKSDGTPVEVSESLEKTLSAMGYFAELGTEFNVTWELNNGQNNVTLNGGEKRYYYIYATFMNTFQLLDKDSPNSYSIDLNNRRNTASINISPKNLSSYVNSNLKREAYISKSAYRNDTGEHIESINSVKIGDIIDYNLEFIHYGSGDYKNMPMVDDMYGIQALLVPVDKNTSLADKNLEKTTLTENDVSTDYYILSEPNTYRNIYVGTDDNGTVMIADTITVDKKPETDVTVGDSSYSYSGLHTEIKWYFSDLSEDGNYYISTSYHAIIDKNLLQSSTYSIGNIVWMNDRTDKRIYDTLWGSSSTLNSDKEIVTKNSDGTYTTDDDGYSIISKGDSICYRLTLSNPNDHEFTVSGSDIIDELPMTSSDFSWEKGTNVSLEYDTAQTSKVIGLDDWSITTTHLGISQSGQYYISWPSTTSISIPAHDKFVMYVILDFPNDEENSEMWTKYCDDLKGDRLYNSFYVYNFPSTVSHSLKDNGKVLLQKGVYSTNYYLENRYYKTSSRFYYNNRDSSNRAIAYYMVLYNDGNNRLYIDDIYDKLPKGFTFKSMISSGAYSTNQYTPVSAISTKDSPNISSYPLVQTNINDISYRNAIVKCTADGQNLCFRISSGSGNYAIKYDEQEKKYYLERGEALVFGYLCDIGVTANTEDYAKNTAVMKYYDYLDAGAAVISSDKVSVTGKNTELYYDNNDGTRSMKDYTEICDSFDSLSDGQYLVSDVTVKRGGIVPGITAYTCSYINDNETLEHQYETSVGPYATVNWRARMHNSGELSITDYTFIDNFPSLYGLTGSISLNIYDNNGRTIKSFNNFLTVKNRNKDDTQISVMSSKGIYYTLNTTSGEPVQISIKYTESIAYNIKVSLERINNAEILKIVFDGSSFAIPENGGYADITLSGKNFTDVYNNTVYTNYTTIVPNSQIYDSASQGSLIKDGDNFEGVINSSPINVSFAYSTSSVKKVEEIDNPENNTSSTSEKPYIILPNSDKKFKYTLSVNNNTGDSMKKLIFIDNLPEIGDHSPFDKNSLRNSEFKVSFADIPNFTVIATVNGESKTLDSKDYSIKYSTATEFNSDDWSGNTEAKWSDDKTNARSVRIVIIDESGTKMPKDSTIAVTFDCTIDGETQPGMMAWNSFGYHYSILGTNVELEAMPLTVGVKIPDVPTLQKKLVDLSGKEYSATSDAIFSFRVYKGDKIDDTLPYKDYPLTVANGQSVSEKLKLTNSDEWTWINGETYTIVERTQENNFKFGNWNNKVTNSFTFTYNSDLSQTLTCTDIYKLWSLSIVKTDNRDETKTLNGAEFALYSIDESEKILDEVYDTLENPPSKYLEINNEIWYLVEVKTTDENGRIQFSDISGEKCCVIETKAPDKYYIDTTAHIYYNTDTSQIINITNKQIINLPNVGSTGRYILFMWGVFLIVLSGVLFYKNHFIIIGRFKK